MFPERNRENDLFLVCAVLKAPMVKLLLAVQITLKMTTEIVFKIICRKAVTNKFTDILLSIFYLSNS
jgi:hypothetical protein